MPKLEIIIDSERSNKHIGILKQHLPELRQEARSSFYIILGCYVPAQLNEQEKAWLQGMIDAYVIKLYRCKEREDR